MTQTNPQIQPLTTNVSTTVTYNNDAGATMSVVFNFLDQPLWQTLVSHASPTSMLMADKGAGAVTLKSGATVNLSLTGQTGTVLFTGIIQQEDSGTPFNNTVLASFQIATS